jgi:transcriptional regulator with XRE-family HTH domain
MTDKEFSKRLYEFYSDVEKIKKKEQWHIIYINGEKTNYAVSNLGSLTNLKTGKVKECPYGRYNYVARRIKVGNKGVKFLLHRLVAFYFCKIPKRLREQGLTYKDLVVNHKNGIRSCNAAFNLEWVTQRENMEHAFNTGLCTDIYGEKSHLSKITNEQAEQICKLIMERKTNKTISEMMNVSEKIIQRIRSKEDWNEISDKYDFPKLTDTVPYSNDESKIHEVCKLLQEHKYNDFEIAEMTGMDRRYINDIRNKKRRTDISSQYNIDSSSVKPLSDDDIKKACELLEKGELSQRKIAKECNMSQNVVSRIYNKKIYTEISQNYNF